MFFSGHLALMVKYMLGSDAHGFTYFFLHYDWKLI